MTKFIRLQKNADYKSVYRLGKSSANRYLVLYMYPNGTSTRRFGFSISKKVGNAVCRNRLRRLLKEICRLSLDRFPDGHDFVFIVRQPAFDQEYHQLERHVWHVLSKLIN